MVWFLVSLSSVEVAPADSVGGYRSWIMVPLGHQRFFSLGELNIALRNELERYNDRLLSRENGTRRTRFRELDRPALGPLPARRYEHAT
jgi:hypothetical protein